MTDSNTYNTNLEYKILPGTGDTYGINELGKVKNLKTGKFLKQNINAKGFWRFRTCYKRKEKTWITHNTLAKLWVENPGNLPEVGFRDGNVNYIVVWNLEWVEQHAKRNNAYREYGNDQLRDYYSRSKVKNK